MDAFAVHVVDGIAATATDADNLDDTMFLLRLAEVEDIECIVLVCHNCDCFFILLRVLPCPHQTS